MARCNKRMERTDWCDLPAAHEGPCKFSPLERSRPAAPVTGTITIDANVLAGQILLILDNGGPWEEREAEVRSILRACHSRDGVEVAAQRTDGLRELIDALYGHLIVSDATCECGEQEIGSEEQHKKHLSAMANPTYAALIQKRDREWALVCAEHDIAALADSNGPIKLNPDALRASVREADVQAADEVLVGEVSDSIRERVCWAIRNDGSAIVAHPEKAAQPINWEAATLHLLACSKLVADCHVCRRISQEAKSSVLMPLVASIVKAAYEAAKKVATNACNTLADCGRVEVAINKLSPESAILGAQIAELEAIQKYEEGVKHDLRCTPVFDHESLTSSGACVCGKGKRIAELESQLSAARAKLAKEGRAK